MTDELLISLNLVCNMLLPILGSAVLIMLIVFLKRCIALVDECTQRVKQLESTVKGVDQSIEKIQTPLDTAVKVSGSIDRMHDSAEVAVKQAVSFVSNNIGTIKDNLVKSKPYTNNPDVDCNEDVNSLEGVK